MTWTSPRAIARAYRDARNDIVERLGHAYRRLGRRLDENASRARCECRGHLLRVFLNEVCVRVKPVGSQRKVYCH